MVLGTFLKCCVGPGLKTECQKCNRAPALNRLESLAVPPKLGERRQGERKNRGRENVKKL
ncbi:hypothetical protein HK27_00340 [Acetobacter orientalis]|nr:hypothetical protein HK27_00340 [Acetobacter orientalis]